MRKVSAPFKKKGHKGWYIRWFINSKEVTRCLPTKTIAEHYRHIKYQELNYDVFQQSVGAVWDDAKKQYFDRFVRQGLAASTKKQSEWFFNQFEEYAHPMLTTQLTQSMIDGFLSHRIKTGVNPYTLNSDIGQLRKFIAWLVEYKYHPGNIKLKTMKAPPVVRTALSDESVQQLLKRCPDDSWRLKILLSLTCDVRKDDIDKLQTVDIDLDKMVISIIDKKTQRHKNLIIHQDLKKLIKAQRTNGNLFDNKNQRKIWSSFAQGVTRKDLRVTNKTLLQMIGNLDSVKGLIGHADYSTTKKYYTDLELVQRWKVNQLPVKNWLNQLLS